MSPLFSNHGRAKLRGRRSFFSATRRQVASSCFIIPIAASARWGASRCCMSGFISWPSAPLGTLRRFNRADAIEPLAVADWWRRCRSAARRHRVDEAWADLGENLLGYDETVAHQTALAAPAHAMILWQRVEKALRKTPLRLRSTRSAEFVALGQFMRQEVAPKARALRARLARRRH